VPVPADEPRGHVRRVVAQYREEGALIVQSGGVDALQLRHPDALELVKCAVAEVHLSDIESREDWRRHSVITP